MTLIILPVKHFEKISAMLSLKEILKILIPKQMFLIAILF